MVKLKDIIEDLKLGKVYTDRDRPPFKVESVDEGYSLRDVGYSKFFKKLSDHQRQAVSIALVMGGNMTGAVKAIEKIKKGLSKDKKVKNALKLANESVNEKVNPDIKQIYKLLMKYGMSAKKTAEMMKKHWKYVSKKYKNSSPRGMATALIGLHSLGEGIQQDLKDANEKLRKLNK